MAKRRKKDIDDVEPPQAEAVEMQPATSGELPSEPDSGPPDRIAEHLAAEEAAADTPGQQFFDGLAPVRHQAVDDAADRYNAIKLQRCELSKQEADAKQGLLLKMIAHSLTRYKTTQGWIVELVNDQKVKTRREDGESVSRVGHVNPGSDEGTDADLDIDEE